MHPNTQFIIDWTDRMMKKHSGFCGAVFCEALAEYCNEAGNEDPSNRAVEVAQKWEEDFSLFLDFIRASKKWCLLPTMGCLHYCDVWREI